MSDNHIAGLDNAASEVKKAKRKICKMDDADNADDCPIPMKLIKRIILSLTKPSYVLELGTKNVRADTRRKLQRLLKKLVRQHNWKEASGVLSMLLKGTSKDSSPELNRMKYWVTMEILKHIEGGRINSMKVRHIYEIWMRKIGSMKNQPLKDRFEVQLEFIIFSLMQGNFGEAHQAAIGLMQEHEFGKDGLSNMVVGLAYYQSWYATIPKDKQLRDLEGPCIHIQSDMSETRYSSLVEDSKRSYDSLHEAETPFECDSDTSVRNDKIVFSDAANNPCKELSAESDVGLRRENLYRSSHPQSFYMNSAENTENEEASFSSYGDDLPHASVFTASGGLVRLDPSLLPLQLPLSREDFNDNYKGAVKYLQLALDSDPPELAALLPLIQLLMIGNQVNEALHLLEKFCCNSNTALPFRLRASLLERFDYSNHPTISTSYEEILKNDPTCSYSLAKLISMHSNGNYSPESLLEMIALHLDASYAECNTWKEFALCFLRLTQGEEDRMSVCLNGNESGHKETYSVRYNRIPKVFTELQSAKSWSFRCKWWLRRHFTENMLASEITAGDLPLLTYKAACACHMYGKQLDYVVKAYTCLEKENGEMFMFLQTHMQNSIGFYLNFAHKTI